MLSMKHKLEKEDIIEKAEYCLNCKHKPCVNACPLKNDIPEFIKELKENNIDEAYRILTNTTVLGSICGEICPHEKFCQGSCIRSIKSNPVSIGKLEKYVWDNVEKKEINIISDELKGKKIAIIGGGPTGLTCSAFLARNGATVTIYEKQEELGGILRYGIPEFRLDKKELKKTIDRIINLGINVKYNKKLGEDYNLVDLKDKYDAIFLSFGANVSSKMNIEGENLKGVYGGNELLEKGVFPDYTKKKVAIIGGGNVAIDAAREIKKLCAQNVYIIYRRAEEQMPAEVKEIEAAKKQGIEFIFQNRVNRIIGNSNKEVQKIECIKTELIQREGESRKVPIDIKDSNYLIDVDYVIMAVGSVADKSIVDDLELETTEYGYIKINDKYMTSKEKIFAGGDLSGFKSTVAWAAKSGREAAESIKEYLIK